MSSERPRTPPRSALGLSENATSTPASQDIALEVGHIPRLHNLIFPLRDAVSMVPKHIPSTMLGAEAVDSSVFLGYGASFSVSRQRISEGPKRIEVTTYMTDWSVTKSSPAPARPDLVVYKVARIAFAGDGQALPEYRRALDQFLMEIHALIYPPLFQHENIINFLGFAWGSNPFSADHKLPAIILEYAQHGTLADLLRKSHLDYDMKHTLCLDVARGLLAVHQAGLLHGDVKAENVLICSHPDRDYVGSVLDSCNLLTPCAQADECYVL